MHDSDSDANITRGTLSFISERLISDFYNLVISAFRESGMTQAELAKRLDKDKGLLSRQLSSPGNWTIDTAAKLFFAASGKRVLLLPQEIGQLSRAAPAESIGATGGAASNEAAVRKIEWKTEADLLPLKARKDIGTHYQETLNAAGTKSLYGNTITGHGVAAE